MNGNLKLAIQKNGRLTEKSLQLLRTCGLDIENYSNRLIVSARNYDLDLLFLRDDDIPEYVQDGVADIGIVGEDIVIEKQADVSIIKKLAYGKCKLMLAGPEDENLFEIEQMNGKRVATSYPKILSNFLKNNRIDAKVIQISGSVEIAPSLGIADYICDIVSTGNTLKLNKLKKFTNVFDSEAVLIGNRNLENDQGKYNKLNKLISRIDSALNAKTSKYLMMNIPKTALDEIREILPSLSSPTVLPLASEKMLAVHAVIPSEMFWEIQEDLTNAGASGILLMPIENMII
ncbi:MAG: ATP phosphoribosyltransferase [Ignavibacteriae bacterium HGW-Ignavibacteriae-3]|nr:MAG: ATP phosphoribosyltransferase [Ignavibacteriae bacterium HGW-Ignavibacteriae-3]